MQRRRLAAATTLVFLSPFTAEFLLGDQYLAGPPSPHQIGMFALFAAFYGAAALLIREIVRRTGRGWPTMLLLSLAFGVFEEGLLTQSLFNPDYAGQHLLDVGYVPALGIAVPWTIYVLMLHTIWSMATPIAIAEALFGREPWLKKVGVSLWTVSFVLGSLATFGISLVIGPKPFFADPIQLTVSAVVAAALVVLALRLRTTAWTSTPGNPWVAFGVALVTSSALQLLFRTMSNAALDVTVLLVPAAIAVAYVLRFRPPAFPLAAGTMVTYCWLGLPTAAQSGTPALIEQSVLVLVALGVLFVTARRPKPALVEARR